MADLNKTSSQIGIIAEVTEGTYVTPAAATDYVQPLEDGFEFSVSKELLERTILTSGIGNATPRTGLKSAAGALPCEFRASGTEGGEPDFDLLLQSALGNQRQTTTQTTTKAAVHTTTQIEIEDADIGDFAVGDGIVVLESGSHEHVVVTAVDPSGGAANITVSPAMSGAPSSAVVIAKFTTYYTSANNTSSSMSISHYIGNGGVSQRTLGARVASMSVDNWTTGQLSSFNFGIEALSGSEELESSPFTPSFDSGLPPVILSACVYQDGTSFDVNTVGLSLTNTWAQKTVTCDPNGITNLIATDRAITGTLDPYKSDANVDQWDNFDNNTEYALIILASTPSSTSGELTLGSCVSIYLPQCITVEKPLADLNNIVQDAISFQATGGSSGSSLEMTIGMV